MFPQYIWSLASDPIARDNYESLQKKNPGQGAPDPLFLLYQEVKTDQLQGRGSLHLLYRLTAVGRQAEHSVFTFVHVVFAQRAQMKFSLDG